MICAPRGRSRVQAGGEGPARQARLPLSPAAQRGPARHRPLRFLVLTVRLSPWSRPGCGQGCGVPESLREPPRSHLRHSLPPPPGSVLPTLEARGLQREPTWLVTPRGGAGEGVRLSPSRVWTRGWHQLMPVKGLRKPVSSRVPACAPTCPQEARRAPPAAVRVPNAPPDVALNSSVQRSEL